MLRAIIDSISGLRFAEELTRHERLPSERSRGKWFKLFNQQMDEEINESMREADFLGDELDITVVRSRHVAVDEHGFIDWFDSDVSGGFHSYADDELASELKAKAATCYPPEEADALTMFFCTPTQIVEANFSRPYHERLAQELETLPEDGPERQKALSRIRYRAKRIGLETTQIRIEWR